jgi:hypothetical protein
MYRFGALSQSENPVTKVAGFFVFPGFSFHAGIQMNAAGRTVNHRFNDKMIRTDYAVHNECERRTANESEGSFRFQNKLQSILDETQRILGRDENVYEGRKHLSPQKSHGGGGERNRHGDSPH